jgi:uncharacterized LabA/DUF88 family protein
MRSHCAVYVDAGYLIAAAATRVTGTSLRSGVVIDYASLIKAMITQAETESRLPVLRVNWYDSGARPGGLPDRIQEDIGLLPRVKLRLGRLGFSGEQKGVDLRIGLDLVAHARNNAVDLMYLVSGDDDLTEAVEEAQGHGVQVIVLAVPDKDGSPHGVSRHLQRECDGVEILAPASIDTAVARQPSAAPPVLKGMLAPSPAILAGSQPPSSSVVAPRRPRPPRDAAVVYSSSTGDQSLDQQHAEMSELNRALIGEVCEGVLESWGRTATPDQWTQLHTSRPSIPPDIDRALLIDLSARLDLNDLDERLRFELRRVFWERVDKAISTQA